MISERLSKSTLAPSKYAEPTAGDSVLYLRHRLQFSVPADEENVCADWSRRSWSTTDRGYATGGANEMYMPKSRCMCKLGVPLMVGADP